MNLENALIRFCFVFFWRHFDGFATDDSFSRHLVGFLTIHVYTPLSCDISPNYCKVLVMILCQKRVWQNILHFGTAQILAQLLIGQFNRSSAQDASVSKTANDSSLCSLVSRCLYIMVKWSLVSRSLASIP